MWRNNVRVDSTRSFGRLAAVPSESPPACPPALKDSAAPSVCCVPRQERGSDREQRVFQVAGRRELRKATNRSIDVTPKASPYGCQHIP